MRQLVAVAVDDDGLEQRAIDTLHAQGGHALERADGRIVNGSSANFDPLFSPQFI